MRNRYGPKKIAGGGVNDLDDEETPLNPKLLRSSLNTLIAVGLSLVGLAILGLVIGALITSIQARDNTAATQNLVNSYLLTNTIPKITCGNNSIAATDGCYDVIIVGAGTAGCTLAGKLVRAGKSVLLIEAGDDRYPKDQVTYRSEAVERTSFYYNTSTPLPQPCQTNDGRCYWQLGGPEPGLPTTQCPIIFPGGGYWIGHGNGFGGGSAVNFLVVTRGDDIFWNAMDSASGSHGVWNSANVFNVMKAQESYSSQGQFTASTARGSSGLWENTVRPAGPTTSINAFWSAVATGFASRYPGVVSNTTINDYNDPATPVGVFTRWDWQQRWSTAPNFFRETSCEAFLGPSILSRTTYTGVNGNKIVAALNQTVLRLLWDPYDPLNCIGVEYYDFVKQIYKKAYASNSVVLSANIQDVGLLEREGIGPVDVLTAAGVPVRVTSPTVGKLHNHYGVALGLISGLYGGGAMDGNPGGTSPGGASLPTYLNPTSRQVIDFGFDGGPGLYFWVPTNIRTDGGGKIFITNPSPDQEPGIVTNVFCNSTISPSCPAVQRDAENLVKHMMEFVNLTNTVNPAAILAGLNLGNFQPIPLAQLQNETFLNLFIRSNMVSHHHWSAWASVGTNVNNGVVNYRTRVFGTRGLRVCDCGIFHTSPSGNTATPAVALGDICGTLLLQDIANGGDLTVAS